MSLRELEENEVEEIAEVLVKDWQRRNLDYDKEWATDYLKNGHSKEIEEEHFYVYEENGEKKAFASLVKDVNGVVEIRDEGLLPGFKDEQTMTMLLMQLISEATAMDARKIYCLTPFDRLQTFRELEFEQEGVLKDHFKEGEDLVMMSRFL